MSYFWSLNLAKHSVSSIFSRSSLDMGAARKIRVCETAAPPTKPRILNHKLFYYHMPITAALSFREKTFFTESSSSFRGRFPKGCCRKNNSLLSLDFKGNDAALLPRRACLSTSPPSLKRLALSSLVRA